MDKQPSPHSVSSVARNISIGVITSVLAATVIYFLGYNKDEKAEFKKKKDATIKVWNAYRENLDITGALFYKLQTAIKAGDTNIVETRTAINHELEASLSAMENIKKEPNADTRVYSTIDIKVQQGKELLALTNRFFDDVSAFIATNPTDAEGQAYVNRVDPEFIRQKAAITQRDSARLAVYYEGLNKEYEMVFPKKE